MEKIKKIGKNSRLAFEKLKLVDNYTINSILEGVIFTGTE